MTKTRALIVSIAFGLATIIALAQPKMEMQDEYNWGSVTPEGPLTRVQSLTARVPIKNTGNQTLVVTGIRPQCGCTTAPIERDTIPPGEETAINVTLNLPSGSGDISKYVTVFANDLKGTHVLQLRAQVQRPLQLSSSYLGFLPGTVGEPSKSVVTIYTFVDTPVTIIAKPLTEGLRLLSAPVLTGVRDKPVVVEVEYTPIKAGAFTVQLMLETSLDDYKQIDLSGYGNATEPKPAGK